MYILDTDVLGFYLREPLNYPHLYRRIKEADAKELLCTTVITVEEMTAGSIASIRNARVQQSEEIVRAYKYLSELINDLKKFIILPFDKEAYNTYQTIPKKVRKGAVNDCRIAAIAISKGYTVITNNGKDFSRIEDETFVKVGYWVNAPQT